jgi:hypothetical protein
MMQCWWYDINCRCAIAVFSGTGQWHFCMYPDCVVATSANLMQVHAFCCGLPSQPCYGLRRSRPPCCLTSLAACCAHACMACMVDTGSCLVTYVACRWLPSLLRWLQQQAPHVQRAVAGVWLPVPPWHLLSHM